MAVGVLMSVNLCFDVCLSVAGCLSVFGCLSVCLCMFLCISFCTGDVLSKVLVFKSDILLRIADCTVGRYAGIQPRDSVGSHQEFTQ